MIILASGNLTWTVTKKINMFEQVKFAQISRVNLAALLVTVTAMLPKIYKSQSSALYLIIREFVGLGHTHPIEMK